MTASALTRPGQRERLSSKLSEIDWRLVGLIAVIAGAGVAMLYSIAGGAWQPWALNQLIRFVGMVFVMLALALVNPRWWFRAAYPLYGVLMVLVLLIEFTPLGYEPAGAGAKNWLNLGFIRIQPAEFIKLGLVLALARWYQEVAADHGIGFFQIGGGIAGEGAAGGHRGRCDVGGVQRLEAGGRRVGEGALAEVDLVVLSGCIAHHRDPAIGQRDGSYFSGSGSRVSRIKPRSVATNPQLTSRRVKCELDDVSRRRCRPRNNCYAV